MQWHSPGFFLVSSTRETQMNKIATVSPASTDERKRHLDSHFVVIIRPAAVEIESHIALRLAQHPLDQVVLIGERARHAGTGPEHVGILPDGVERNHTA